MKFVVLVIALMSAGIALTQPKVKTEKKTGQWVESVCYAYVELSAK
jgi:hypothetical protein